MSVNCPACRMLCKRVGWSSLSISAEISFVKINKKAINLIGIFLDTAASVSVHALTQLDSYVHTRFLCPGLGSCKTHILTPMHLELMARILHFWTSTEFIIQSPVVQLSPKQAVRLSFNCVACLINFGRVQYYTLVFELSTTAIFHIYLMNKKLFQCFSTHWTRHCHRITGLCVPSESCSQTHTRHNFLHIVKYQTNASDLSSFSDLSP